MQIIDTGLTIEIINLGVLVQVTNWLSHCRG